VKYGVVDSDPDEDWILVDDEGNSYDVHVESANPIEFVHHLHIPDDNSYLEIIPFMTKYLRSNSTNAAFLAKPSQIVFQAVLPPLDPVLMPASKLPRKVFPHFVADEGIFLSALKLSHKRDGIIIRFFNPANSEKKISFEERVEVVNMAEEPLGMTAKDITMKPGEVVTVKLPLGG